ncbi:hypothetical protein [Natronorubrum tibetense]|uniref:Uncharacterized protein n=1 Tax=Natronorubrum tibetense GA33 TaxID=1114856 RepID=L9W0S5_9EURY|nr:hypothetical protein [Natronorubrum tibetense]ELY43089.1 hypothetical protein C496_05202 [Natronorubrum tibetense GA33]
MTPVAILAAFCATMAAIAVWRLATDDRRDRVDVGSALTVVGITVLAVLWTALEEGWLTAAGRGTLGVVGACLVGAGIVMMVRYWDDPPEPNCS